MSIYERRPNTVAAGRRRGQPDTRPGRRLHDLANHGRAIKRVDDAIEMLRSIPAGRRENIETRVEEVKRVPRWQERIMTSKKLGKLGLNRALLSRYRDSFTMLEYAYGVSVPETPTKLYYIKQVLRGYVIPSPIPAQKQPKEIRSRTDELVIVVDGSASWLGAVHAHKNARVARCYDDVVAVGPDIDAHGSQGTTIEDMSTTQLEIPFADQTKFLSDIASKLIDLGHTAHPPQATT